MTDSEREFRPRFIALMDNRKKSPKEDLTDEDNENNIVGLSDEQAVSS